jgi:hypothetical protein
MAFEAEASWFSISNLKRICPFWPFALRQHIFFCIKPFTFGRISHFAALQYWPWNLGMSWRPPCNFFDCKLAGPPCVAVVLPAARRKYKQKKRLLLIMKFFHFLNLIYYWLLLLISIILNSSMFFVVLGKIFQNWILYEIIFSRLRSSSWQLLFHGNYTFC